MSLKYAPIVRELLLTRRDLTHGTIISMGHGWRLAAVIYRLRWAGWPIETVLDGRHVAHYRLQPGWRPPQNKTPEPGKNGGLA